MTKLERGIYALLVATGFTLCGWPALAQQYEADGILKRAANHLGANEVATLRYGAAGNSWFLGQAYTAGKAYPKMTYRVTRSIDFTNAAMTDEIVRKRTEQRGGSGVTYVGEQNITEAVGGNVAWDVVNKNVFPETRVGERVAQIWLNPLGIIKAAQNNNATLRFVNEGKKSLGVVSFTEAGRFSAKVYINGEAEVERIEALVSNAVMGDMPVVEKYSEYREFGRIKFPTRIEETQGGLPTLQLVVTDVQPNAKVAIEVPPAAANFKMRVVSTKLADGVWFLGGFSHNSLAVEMKDYAVVVEAPMNDMRSAAILEETRKLIPGKPIRYLLNTHTHFDHSGGVAAFAAAGATIVTYQANKAYLERALGAKRTVSPDALALSKKKAKILGVGEKYLLSDGSRSIEMHHLKGSIHNDAAMLVYLPKEKLLIQADHPGGLAPGAKPPADLDPRLPNMLETVERLKLDVVRVAPIHGPVHNYADVKRLMAK